MSRRRRVVSPRIVESPRAGPIFLLTILVLVAIAGAFFAGIFVAREEAAAIASRLDALLRERNELSGHVAALTQENMRLERSMEIDREANRTALQSLRTAQDERLELEKEVSFLKRLIEQGGGGILKVKDFKLTIADEPGHVATYSFTISQLIRDFGESAGRVEIRLVGKRDGKEVERGLDKLPGSEPSSHKMRFKHFQNFEGRIKLPDGFEPERFVVDVKPSTKKLIPVTETFAWDAEG